MKSTKKKMPEEVREDGLFRKGGRYWSEESFNNARQYKQAYMKKTYRTFTIRINADKEQDMIDYLENKENFSSFVKGLIRKEMDKENETSNK